MNKYIETKYIYLTFMLILCTLCTQGYSLGVSSRINNTAVTCMKTRGISIMEYI